MRAFPHRLKLRNDRNRKNEKDLMPQKAYGKITPRVESFLPTRTAASPPRSACRLSDKIKAAPAK